ncbi:MAG TPA: NAD+ synthase [Phaeodactylibacter sp.]|nr:NAD+ synthase [Phaeodactylibacter sp.]
MKVALAQLNYHIGAFEKNLEKMLRAVEEARAAGADIICFAELAVCGYPPRDFLEFEDFIRRSEQSVQHLAKAAKDIAIVVGAPSRNPVVEGKDLYNSAWFLADGKVLQVQHKTLLPTYDIFDEYRYFEPATEHRVVEYKGYRIALTICEDIWNIGNENPLYTICPLDEMQAQKPDFVINISASPFNYMQARERLHVLKANTRRYGIPFFYVNHVGAQTELIFDGGSVFIAPDGKLLHEMPYFEEQLQIFELEEAFEASAKEAPQPKEKLPLIHRALVLGIRDYFQKLGFQKAILGLSGGLDSALTAVLACEALGPENVLGLIMPSEFSSQHSVTDARQLAENLGMKTEMIPIEETFSAFRQTLEPWFDGLPFNVTEENLQARIRGTLLMAFSNKFGHILLNTTNKSEMAVGYGTLYGDLAGGLSVIGDIYKTEVFALSRLLNEKSEIIPQHIIEKPPSAELRPDQKDTDSLPPYEILDPILYQYIEKRQGPREIIALGFEPALVKRILRMVNINEFKRYQTAPVLRVSPKAFGMGRRMPIVAKYLN